MAGIFNFKKRQFWIEEPEIIALDDTIYHRITNYYAKPFE